MVQPQEDKIRSRATKKSSCVRLKVYFVYKSNWTKITASRLSYVVGLNGKE